MKKFSYIILEQLRGPDGEQQMLNSYGSLGAELVAVFRTDDGRVKYYFKNESPDEVPPGSPATAAGMNLIPGLGS